MVNKYKYNAFISYRHISPDKEIAEKLQKKLENYKPPRSLSVNKKTEKWRIFRDETELPTSSNLSADIKKALDESEYLIVVCSKNTAESRWCMEEIEYFKQLHNGNNSNIITLVADGNPEEVFPEALCNELIPVTDEAGNVTYQKHVIEPLAANVAGKNLRESVKKLNTEFLRIAAPLLGCGYDNLYNREHKKKIKRIFTIGGIAMSLLLLFAVYNGIMLWKINNQKIELARANSEHLGIISENLWNSGDGTGAIQTALSALPDNGSGMPVVPSVVRILANEVGAYRPDNFFAVAKLNCESRVTKIGYAGNGETVVCQDLTGVYFWNSKTGELKKKYSNQEFGDSNIGIDVYFDEDGLYKGLGAEKYAVGVYSRDGFNYLQGYKRDKADLTLLSGKDVLITSHNGIYKLNGTNGEILWKLEVNTNSEINVTNTKIIVSENIYNGQEKAGVKVKVFDRTSGKIASELLLEGDAISVGASTEWIDITDKKAYLFYDDSPDKTKLISFVSGNKLLNPKIIYTAEKDALYAGYDSTVFDEVKVINNEIFVIKTHWDNLEYYFITEIVAIDEKGNEKWKHSYKNECEYGGHIRFALFDKESCENFCDILAVAKGDSVELLNSKTGAHILTYELDSVIKNSYCSKDGMLTVFTSAGYEVAVLGRHIESKEEAEKSPIMIQLHKFMNAHSIYACSGYNYAVTNENSNEIYLYSDVENKDYTRMFTNDDSVKEVSINASQTYMLISTYHGLHVYNIKSGETYELTKDDGIWDAVFASDHLCAIGRPEGIEVYDIRTKEIVFKKEMKLQSFSINAVYAGVVGDNVIIKGNDGELLFLKDNETVTWKPEKIGEEKQEGYVSEFYISENSEKILAEVKYTLEKTYELYDVNTHEVVTLDMAAADKDEQSDKIRSIRWSDNNEIIVAFADETIWIFDENTGKSKCNFNLEVPPIVSVVPLKDGKEIGVLCNDSVLYRVDVSDKTIIDSLELDNEDIKTSTGYDRTKTTLIDEGSILMLSGWYQEYGRERAYLIDMDAFDVMYDVDGIEMFWAEKNALVVKEYNSIGYYPLYSVEKLMAKAKEYIAEN